ncbi:MAG: hypothetical protein CM1200mP2_04900 [Planctomycetaceae bacterium]|nr:MAG: hypothetical protein CM1200mP2_04900 [Planctomycetaceae bacterium]
MSSHDVVLIPGDGIGPEVTAAACKILEGGRRTLSFQVHRAGLAALDRARRCCHSRRRSDPALWCGVEGPPARHRWAGVFTSVNVQLRQRLNLFAAVRPVRNLAGVEPGLRRGPGDHPRETEGLYSGVRTRSPPSGDEHEGGDRDGLRRIALWGFPVRHSPQKEEDHRLPKSEIMKITDGLFLRCARKVHQSEYPNIEYEEVIIDAGCMKLVQDPSSSTCFCWRIVRDGVSDLCAGWWRAGGVPGPITVRTWRCSRRFTVRHPTSRPGVANPGGDHVAVMMLNHLAETRDDPSCRESADRNKAATTVRWPMVA